MRSDTNPRISKEYGTNLWHQGDFVFISLVTKGCTYNVGQVVNHFDSQQRPSAAGGRDGKRLDASLLITSQSLLQPSLKKLVLL